MEKRAPVWAWSSSILGDILNFNVNLDEKINNKTNFLMGGAAVIIVFAMGLLSKPEFSLYTTPTKIGWMILLIGCFLSFLMSILIITPRVRIFSKREKLKEDLFYYKNITHFFSRKEYLKQLHRLKSDSKMITESFGNLIYHLSKVILPFKSKLLRLAGWTLFFSLVIGTIFVLIGLFVF